MHSPSGLANGLFNHGPWIVGMDWPELPYPGTEGLVMRCRACSVVVSE